jgi:hypothetical protein
MGSSGAGKVGCVNCEREMFILDVLFLIHSQFVAHQTTLMDVLALRKSSGEIEGEVRLNGHLQEPLSFRRCTGYVEQFDVQSSQLTGKKFIYFCS